MGNYENYMNLSLLVAANAPENVLKVGAVLVSNGNKVLCSSFTEEQKELSWSNVLASKIKSLGIRHADFLYVTISTYDKASQKFDLMNIINEVQVDTIFVGLPDPALTTYHQNDPLMMFDNIKRYPDKFQRKILLQNKAYYVVSPQSINNIPYYCENRISTLVVEQLKQKGANITKEELHLHKSKNALIHYILEHSELEYAITERLVNEAISEAFNKKYGTYQYSNDTRSLDTEWCQKFKNFFYMTANHKIEDINIINIGVGGGHEASSLFSKCKNITFVDVAIDGLLQIQNNIPSARIVNASADNLAVIEDNSYDTYISLRTYNSSFFDISKAITEARRILKPNASIIVSVANGFLCSEKGIIISGLLIPGTEFIDIYRGMDTIKLLKKEYTLAGFKNVQLCPTKTEIYLSAIAA